MLEETKRFAVVIFVEKNPKDMMFPDWNWLLEKQDKFGTSFLWLFTPYCLNIPSTKVVEVTKNAGLHIHFSENFPQGSWNGFPQRDKLIKNPKNQIELLDNCYKEWGEIRDKNPLYFSAGWFQGLTKPVRKYVSGMGMKYVDWRDPKADISIDNFFTSRNIIKKIDVLLRTCYCGHLKDDHNEGVASCMITGCTCAGFEPVTVMATHTFDPRKRVEPALDYFLEAVKGYKNMIA